MNFWRSWLLPDRGNFFMLHIFLLIVQVVSALCVLVLVMLQRGKGAEAGAGFGAGASGTVFGARGATTALSRATAVFAAIFMINSLVLTYLATRPQEQTKTLLDIAGQTQAPAPSVIRQPNSTPASAPRGAPATAAPGGTAPPQPQQPPQPQPQK
jgi:preprotein translocase subunit SecG